MSAAAMAAAPLAATAPAPGSLAPAVGRLSGWLWGGTAALVWGGYMAFARAGVVGGLAPIDFALLRFLPAALIMLPFLARRGLRDAGGIGWGRGAVLTALAGPAFILLGTLSFLWAPLAHAAVLQPGMVTLGAMALAVLLLGERVPGLRWVGAGVVVAGLALVSGAGLTGGEAWRGDLCFVAAGLLWALFTVASRRWRVDPLAATAVVSVLGGLVAVPLWLALGDASALLAQGWGVIGVQALVQGPLSGVLAVYAFSRAVAALGAARAALFPAMVPVVAVLLGLPVAGEWPTAGQWLGLAVVMAGLPVAMGLLRRG
jgi:drug/metabolite transporter (DMT)-like permease